MNNLEIIIIGVAILGLIAFVALVAYYVRGTFKKIKVSEATGARNLKEDARGAKNMSWLVGVGYFVVLGPLFIFFTLNDANPQASPPVLTISLLYLISPLITQILYTAESYKGSLIASRIVYVSPIIVIALLLFL